MIYLIHHENKVKEVLDNGFNSIQWPNDDSITNTLFNLAKQYPDELIIWCLKSYKDHINKKALIEIFHSERVMASYSNSKTNYIHDSIGYIEQSVFLKVNKKVTYPTWLMSSDIGGIHAKLLVTIFQNIERYQDFDFFINSLAKKGMSQGLFCYSEPDLLLSRATLKSEERSSVLKLFKFVKIHYKASWIFYLFFCLLMYERKFPLVSLLNAFRYKKHNDDFDFEKLNIKSTKKVLYKKEVDVIIPTMGRKIYLHDVLKDLSVQSILPKNVIIVEQNPEPDTKSELDYLYNQNWPFNIKHKFIHRTGVCNARNLALQEVTSEWTLLGDDDNRFKPDLIEGLLDHVIKLGQNAVTTVYLQPNEKQTFFKTSQTQIFGGGNSLVNSNLLKNVKFDSAYEFGYGEDNDFGMQIRNLGEDVIFLSDIAITHLKAPTGGYRITQKHDWDADTYLPKPSPTIMLFNQRYFTKEQLLGYKLLLLIKYYRRQPIINPFRYISKMKKQWDSSLFWSKQLVNKSNA